MVRRHREKSLFVVMLKKKKRGDRRHADTESEKKQLYALCQASYVYLDEACLP